MAKDEESELAKKDDEEPKESEEESQELADELASLQAKVKLLRQDGKADNEITCKLYEENFNLDSDLVRQVMNLSKFDIGRIKGHVSRLRHREDKDRLQELEKKARPSASPIYKTDTDSTSVLKEVLATHPDISPRHLEEILSWAKMTPAINIFLFLIIFFHLLLSPFPSFSYGIKPPLAAPYPLSPANI